MSKRYVVVGGVPFTGHTKTMTFTDIKCILATDSQLKAERAVLENWEECAGLIRIIDTETGEHCSIPDTTTSDEITDHSKCAFSSGIGGETTCGQGEVDVYGYFEHPCGECLLRDGTPVKQ